MAAVNVVRARLEQYCAQASDAKHDGHREIDQAQTALADAGLAMPSTSALERLCKIFNLTAFERELLLLCAGVELDSSLADVCARAQGDRARVQPTLSLALAALPDPHWNAVTPAAPLRNWRLIEVGNGPILTKGPLRIDEPVLHYLAGVPHPDDRLTGLVEQLQSNPEMVASHSALAEQIAVSWSRNGQHDRLPVVQLCGNDIGDLRSVTVGACTRLGLRVAALAAQFLPLAPTELDGLMRLWEREAMLTGAALLLECQEVDPSDAPRAAALNRMIDGLKAPLLVGSAGVRRIPRRASLTYEVRNPTSSEQKHLWQRVFSASDLSLNGDADQFVSQFDLNVEKIHSAFAQVMGQKLSSATSSPEATFNFGSSLWDACRIQARPKLDDLAQRIEPAATWTDLVLPKTGLQILREVAVHVRQRLTVYQTWGFATKGLRGLGISALFSGMSGTGKTMAAEVLASELRLDLYRIDLSAVVSKYIGETEKNLRRVFDAAEEGGAILLFDEADALFGKRSEVKDSHDRYANIEVSYLLQRMEAYRGLAILTTNLKSALDTAFLRRLRFIIDFPFPDASLRAEIWRRIFPQETPTDNLDANKLAQLNIAGGNIRNIALHAAFLAADANEPVCMKHMLRAAENEYLKLEKSLSEGEVKGWV
jgi:predicted nucleic acid-binding protein